MLTFFSTFVMLIGIEILAFGSGHLFSSIFRFGFNDHLFKSSSIKVALGVIVITVTTYISFLFSNLYVIMPFILVIISCLGLIIASSSYMLNQKAIFRRKQVAISRAVVWLLVNILMAYTIGNMKWPPFGDSFIHMMVTSLIIFNKSIPETYYPINSTPFYYPSGFHVVPCLFVNLISLYPGEAILIWSGVIFSTILFLVSDMTVHSTKTILSAPLVPLLLFWSSGTKYMTEYLFGYFINGTYPMLLGTLGILLAFLTFDKIRTKRSVVALALPLLIILQELITYPIFTVYLIIPLIILIINNVKYYTNIVLKDKRLIVIFGILILIMVLLSPKIIAFVKNSIYLMQTVRLVPEYIVEARFLLLTPIGLTMLTSIFILLINLFLRKSNLYELITISLCVPGILNVIFPNVDILGILVPLRSLIAASPLLYLNIISKAYSGVQLFLGRIFAKKSIAIYIRFKKWQTRIFTLNSSSKFLLSLLLLVLLLPELFDLISLKTVDKAWLWVNEVGFKDDYAVSEWISKHNPNLRILTDYSQPARQLVGFGCVNITEFEMSLHQIIKHPFDTFLVKMLLHKFGIKRIYLSSSWGFYDFNDGKMFYTHKPFSNLEYLKAFQDFTSVEFYSGSSIVLKVNNFSIPVPVPLQDEPLIN